ncbi:MAG: divalent-cation tolerance protein CutA [Candidatus Nanoarchaeia archaeon]|nr:divalent-cation tolerance protein CutA [Candidatus Nanoarchaeia archaeon]MDD5239804.1 divalent-cation tolerance protein CutA [Candidatus Nanoarchaeia archaeon]
MAFILVYITHKNMEEAKKVVSHLLQKKIIACANFFPIKSSYWWKGRIDETDEVVSIVKTIKGNWKNVKSEVKKIHPYEVPCIMKIDTEANEDYEKWIKEVVK